MLQEEQREGVKVVHRRNYTLLQKIFCCRMFTCCQYVDKSLLTYKDRREMFQKLTSNLSTVANDTVEPFFMLLAIFLGEESEVYLQIMERMNIQAGKDTREDLQFYIPQLCTFLVFHEEMKSRELINLMEKACKFDIHFSYRFYFYLKSLEFIQPQQNLHVVHQYLERLNQIMNERWKFQQQPVQQKVVEQYHKRGLLIPHKDTFKLDALSIENPYIALYKNLKIETEIPKNLFRSTLDFIQDLIVVSEKLITKPNRRQFLIEQLRKINLHLPARINIPFANNNVRDMTVVGIIFEEAKVFSTKQRAPYQICLEVFYQPMPEKTTSSGHETLRRRKSQQKNNNSQLSLSDETNISMNIEELKGVTTPKNSYNKYQIIDKFFQLTRQGKKLLHLNQQTIDEKQQKEMEPYMPDIFPECPLHQLDRIGKNSPYSRLPGYKLLNLIVKSKDNLKQEQFAMQLLYNFNQIFEQQKLKLKLYPYQIISTSHDSGIIEFLEDCITIDELKKKDSSLQAVVQGKERIKNFISSLAAYSLITWLLQVKDRHNGNIMICRDGSIRHIDYGFFISNSPGKNVQIQKSVPFKMSAEYINVLGGADSKNFQEFRKLFCQGYNAARKHQDRILILVKLMYSSHGETMPCFEKGEQAIIDLQQRFNPIGRHTDIQRSLFCQNLINASMDNWRARWYDKWQYFAQGIFY